MKTFLCSHLVELQTAAAEFVVNLEKLSSTLATVNSDVSLATGQVVRLVAERWELSGVVGRCTLELTGYEIDVELASRWSPEQFTPDHLFDPDVMIAPS
jgi:hypothetical protein